MKLLLQLPEEVLIQILANLELTDIQTCSTVCQLFHKVISNDFFWYSKLEMTCCEPQRLRLLDNLMTNLTLSSSETRRIMGTFEFIEHGKWKEIFLTSRKLRHFASNKQDVRFIWDKEGYWNIIQDNESLNPHKQVRYLVGVWWFHLYTRFPIVIRGNYKVVIRCKFQSFYAREGLGHVDWKVEVREHDLLQSSYEAMYRGQNHQDNEEGRKPQSDQESNNKEEKLADPIDSFSEHLLENVQVEFPTSRERARIAAATEAPFQEQHYHHRHPDDADDLEQEEPIQPVQLRYHIYPDIQTPDDSEWTEFTMNTPLVIKTPWATVDVIGIHTEGSYKCGLYIDYIELRPDF